MDRELIQRQKKNFRKRIQDVLKTLPPAEVERQSAVITAKVLSSSEYQNANSLSIFLAMPGKEVSTNEIVKSALRDGKKVYIPYIHASKHEPKVKIMDMLRLHGENDLNSLNPDAWGIPSISEESARHRENALGGIGCLEETQNGHGGSVHLDLIFMPSMAFDTSLNRLGHGKGFYDRYLSLCESLSSKSGHGRKVPQLVGLALREQMLGPEERLPVSELDWKVDRVVTSED